MPRPLLYTIGTFFGTGFAPFAPATVASFLFLVLTLAFGFFLFHIGVAIASVGSHPLADALIFASGNYNLPGLTAFVLTEYARCRHRFDYARSSCVTDTQSSLQ